MVFVGGNDIVDGDVYVVACGGVYVFRKMCMVVNNSVDWLDTLLHVYYVVGQKCGYLPLFGSLQDCD